MCAYFASRLEIGYKCTCYAAFDEVGMNRLILALHERDMPVPGVMPWIRPLSWLHRLARFGAPGTSSESGPVVAVFTRFTGHAVHCS